MEESSENPPTILNRTNQTNFEFNRFNEPSWYIPQALECFLMLLALWLLLCLVCRGIQLGNCASICSKGADKKPNSLYILIVICPVTLLLRLVTSQVALNIGYMTNSDKICETVYDILDFTYFLAILNVYGFLWLRQLFLYSNKILNVTYSKPLRILSAASLVLILLPGIAILALNMYPTTHMSSLRGCLYVPVNDEIDTWSTISIAILFTIGQGIMLGLFVYPLQRNRSYLQTKSCFAMLCCAVDNMDKERLKSKNSLKEKVVVTVSNKDTQKRNYVDIIRQGTMRNNTKTRKTMRARVISILRKTIIGTAIAVVTDVLVILTAHFLFPGGTTRRIDILMYDFNLFLDVALVINTVPGKILRSPLARKDRSTSFFGH